MKRIFSALNCALRALAQSGSQRSLKRIAKPHVVNGKIQTLRGRAYERGQPRHDRVGQLFALSEKENRKSIYAKISHYGTAAMILATKSVGITPRKRTTVASTVREIFCKKPSDVEELSG